MSVKQQRLSLLMVVPPSLLQNQWLCTVCDDVTFHTRWSLERHVLERHSDFSWKCPECRKLFQRRNIEHGCKVNEEDMICFDSRSGSRGKEAEEKLELFKKEELPKKIKLLDGKGKELEVKPKRTRSTPSVGCGRTVDYNRNKNKVNETRKRSASADRRDDRKEKENNAGPSVAKVKKTQESKDEKLVQLRKVLKDLSSNFGDSFSITVGDDSVTPESLDKIIDQYTVVNEEIEKPERHQPEKPAASTKTATKKQSNNPDELELHVSTKERESLDKTSEKSESAKFSVSTKVSGSSASRSRSASPSGSSHSVVSAPPPPPPPKSDKFVEPQHPKPLSIPAVSSDQNRRVVLQSNHDHEMETFLKYLQDTQENVVILNIGGQKYETSKNTLRADPSSVFAMMLKPDSPFRPSKNIYFFDRDPSHFKIILNYLKYNCTYEKRYLPREHVYLYEILQEAKFYRLSGLVDLIKERFQDLCACRLYDGQDV